MNILQASAELVPFAKVGGLADMCGALPGAWQKQGHNVLPIVPLYGHIDLEAFGITRTDLVITVPLGHWTEYATVYTGYLPGTNVVVYFLRSAEYFDRPGIYGYHDGFEDNNRRFIFLSRAAFELARALDFKPDVIHAHDYHTAPMMPMLRIHYGMDPHFSRTAGVFTIHNMVYQGVYEPTSAMELCGFRQEDFYPGCWFEQNGMFNAMKAGIMFADKITTVSPTYAQEIRWTEEGAGLQSALQTRGADLIGVLNGIDNNVWNPASDQLIPLNYTDYSFEKKESNKRALLMELGCSLEQASDGLPLFGMVSRLTDQKGLNLVVDVIESFVRNQRLRFVLLGSGEKKYEEFFHGLQSRHPNMVCVRIGYNEPLSHRIQAGSDFYLMPSKFEPCGLTQMFALAYGTIPIVRAVGGLNDTVEAYDPIAFTGNGIRFNAFSADELSRCIDAALHLYRREPHWTSIRKNAMASQFTIAHTAEQYIELFRWAQERKGIVAI